MNNRKKLSLVKKEAAANNFSPMSLLAELDKIDLDKKNSSEEEQALFADLYIELITKSDATGNVKFGLIEKAAKKNVSPLRLLHLLNDLARTHLDQLDAKKFANLRSKLKERVADQRLEIAKSNFKALSFYRIENGKKISIDISKDAAIQKLTKNDLKKAVMEDPLGLADSELFSTFIKWDILKTRTPLEAIELWIEIMKESFLKQDIETVATIYNSLIRSGVFDRFMGEERKYLSSTAKKILDDKNIQQAINDRAIARTVVSNNIILGPSHFKPLFTKIAASQDGDFDQFKKMLSRIKHLQNKKINEKHDPSFHLETKKCWMESQQFVPFKKHVSNYLEGINREEIISFFLQQNELDKLCEIYQALNVDHFKENAARERKFFLVTLIKFALPIPGFLDLLKRLISIDLTQDKLDTRHQSIALILNELPQLFMKQLPGDLLNDSTEELLQWKNQVLGNKLNNGSQFSKEIDEVITKFPDIFFKATLPQWQEAELALRFFDFEQILKSFSPFFDAVVLANNNLPITFLQCLAKKANDDLESKKNTKSFDLLKATKSEALENISDANRELSILFRKAQKKGLHDALPI